MEIIHAGWYWKAAQSIGKIFRQTFSFQSIIFMAIISITVVSLYFQNIYLPIDGIHDLLSSVVRSTVSELANELRTSLDGFLLTSFFHRVLDEMWRLSFIIKSASLLKMLICLIKSITKPKIFFRGIRRANSMFCYHVNLEGSRTRSVFV